MRTVAAAHSLCWLARYSENSVSFWTCLLFRLYLILEILGISLRGVSEMNNRESTMKLTETPELMLCTRYKQEPQCTYNVALRLVFVTFVAVEKQYYTFGVCVCSLRYPPCIAHALYYYVWCVRPYRLFPHYFINGTFSGKKLLNIKCVFWFSLQLLSKTYPAVRIINRNVIKNVYSYSRKVPGILVRL